MAIPDRAERMHSAVKLLHERIDEYAALMAIEMGKVINEGISEIEKIVGAKIDMNNLLRKAIG